MLRLLICHIYIISTFNRSIIIDTKIVFKFFFFQFFKFIALISFYWKGANKHNFFKYITLINFIEKDKIEVIEKSVTKKEVIEKWYNW